MTVSIAVDESQLVEMMRRSNGNKSVEDIVWSAIQNWLDTTEGDTEIWGFKPFGLDPTTPIKANEFGPPTLGYHWQSVFLANGTRLKMTYKDQDHIAEVRHQQLWYNGRTVYSPSQWVSEVADGTVRNAWRDIFIYRPLHNDWIPASILRQKFMRKARF